MPKLFCLLPIYSTTITRRPSAAHHDTSLARPVMATQMRTCAYAQGQGIAARKRTAKPRSHTAYGEPSAISTGTSWFDNSYIIPKTIHCIPLMSLHGAKLSAPKCGQLMFLKRAVSPHRRAVALSADIALRFRPPC